MWGRKRERERESSEQLSLNYHRELITPPSTSSFPGISTSPAISCGKHETTHTSRQFSFLITLFTRSTIGTHKTPLTHYGNQKTPPPLLSPCFSPIYLYFILIAGYRMDNKQNSTTLMTTHNFHRAFTHTLTHLHSPVLLSSGISSQLLHGYS